MREAFRSSGGVLGVAFCWQSREDFCGGIGRSVTEETVGEMDGAGSSIIFGWKNGATVIRLERLQEGREAGSPVLGLSIDAWVLLKRCRK